MLIIDDKEDIVAKVLDKLPEHIGKRGGPRGTKYPYDEWLDGQARELEAGEDFKVKPTSLIGSIRTAAERKGVEVTVGAADGNVFVQALGPASDNGQAKAKPAKKAAKKSATKAATKKATAAK